jgi:hypothetical protein
MVTELPHKGWLVTPFFLGVAEPPLWGSLTTPMFFFFFLKKKLDLNFKIKFLKNLIF